MAADSTKIEKKNYVKLRIASPRGKGSRKDDRPRAILHTDNIEIDTLLDIDAVHNRMSEECARRLGCEIEIISEKMVSYDCGRTVLGKTDIEVKIVGVKQFTRKTFLILENMDEDIILGLNTIWYLKMHKFFTPPLRCDYYESGYDYDSVGCILSDNEYWDEYTYDNSGYCESDSEDEIDSAKGEILDGVQE
jgi:hypothetical protein